METEFKLTLEIIIGLIGSLFTIYFGFYYNTKKNLEQSLYRKNKISILEAHTFGQKYKTYLLNLINSLDYIYNNSTIIQNYSRHIAIALLYSTTVFIFFWGLGIEGKVGSIYILEEVTVEKRYIAVTTFILMLISYTYIYFNTTKIVVFFSNKLPKKLPKVLHIMFIYFVFNRNCIIIWFSYIFWRLKERRWNICCWWYNTNYRFNNKYRKNHCRAIFNK